MMIIWKRKMSRFCIYCKTAYEDDIIKCPKCNGIDFGYIIPKQFKEYNSDGKSNLGTEFGKMPECIEHIDVDP